MKVSETLSLLCQSALGHAEQGYQVLPVHGVRDGACLCKAGPRCRCAGKHPATLHGLRDATSDPDQIREWWRKNPEANIGIRTGGGFLVLDVDSLESLAWLEHEHGPIPETLTVRTGGGGLHYFFRTNRSIRNSVGKIGPGINIRGEDGYVVTSPSLHVSGQRYSVEVDAPLAEMPDWLVERPTRTPKGRVDDDALHDPLPPPELDDVDEQWVKKGDRLYVERRIEYSETETDGQKKYWTSIVVNELVMLGSGKKASVDPDEGPSF